MHSCGIPRYTKTVNLRRTEDIINTGSLPQKKLAADSVRFPNPQPVSLTETLPNAEHFPQTRP